MKKKDKEETLTYDNISISRVTPHHHSGFFRVEVVPKLLKLIEERPITNEDVHAIYRNAGFKTSTTSRLRAFAQRAKLENPKLNLLFFYKYTSGQRKESMLYCGMREKMSKELVKLILHSGIKYRLKGVKK